MCGIVAVHRTPGALTYLLPALARLEYRGYDSAGVAVSAADGSVARLRSVGRLDALRREVADYGGPTLNGTGIGHTRWATHGAVTVENAHPHLSCGHEVAVVHNGVIDNAPRLRHRLERQGHRFTSDGDSEVVAHLVEDELAAGRDLVQAVRSATTRLQGSWALAVLGRGDDVVVAAHGSPLVVGTGEQGLFASSDASGIAAWVDTVQHLRDGDVVALEQPLRWWTPAGASTAPVPVPHGWDPTQVELGTHPDFMDKEIADQPLAAQALVDTHAGTVASGALWRSLGLRRPDRVEVVACGSSLNAGRVVADVLRHTGLPAQASVASEWRPTGDPARTLTLAISQSGETADVLAAVAQVGGPVVALTNNPMSTLARRADAVLPCLAGQEIGVAATKTFTNQVLAGSVLALSLLAETGLLGATRGAQAEAAFVRAPARLQGAVTRARRTVPALVPVFISAPGVLFLGRGLGCHYAAEGDLKLQELSYIWTRSYPSAELKHGPIALVHHGVPVVVVDDGDPRLRTALAEVSARGATTVRIGGPDTDVPVLPRGVPAPWGPLEAVVGLQVLTRLVSLSLGRDVDKPRNLAKSVTVA